MTPHARAYILRIAASQESLDSPLCAQRLAEQLQADDPTLDAASIARAVAHVRAALDRLPYATIRMELAA